MINNKVKWRAKCVRCKEFYPVINARIKHCADCIQFIETARRKENKGLKDEDKEETISRAI